MSLTQFIARKTTKEIFSKLFQKPKVVLAREIVSPSLTTKAQIVGTAFDYLLRFILEKQYSGKET